MKIKITAISLVCLSVWLATLLTVETGTGFSLQQGAEPLAEMAAVNEAIEVRYPLGIAADGSFSMASGGVDWIGTGQPALLIDGEPPLEDSYVNFASWSADPDFMFASAYLNELHTGRVRNLSRGVAVREGDHVVVSDNLRALEKPLRIRWQLRALTGDVTLNEQGATLRKAGHALQLRVQGPDDLEMKTWPLSSAGGAGETLVGFEFSLPANASQRLEVLLVPETVQATFLGQSFGSFAGEARQRSGHDLVQMLGAAPAALDLDALDPSDPADIRAMLKQACHWQFEHLSPFWNQGLVGWVQAAFYTGVLDLYRDTGYEGCLNLLTEISERHDWRLLRVNDLEWRRADNHLMGEIYLNLALENETLRADALADVTRIYDRMMAQPWPGREIYYWADALYMSPPTWALLAKLTGDDRYLQELDRLYWDVMDHLYSPEWQLVFRDARFIDQVEDNGKPVFWGRGVGWVYGGLVNLLRYLPDDWPTRPKYEELYRSMSKRLAAIQLPDGGWTSSLLYPEKFDWASETSSSGFFVYGLAWGINEGLLDRVEFGKPVEKGWRALVEKLNADGSIRDIQQVGASPVANDGGFHKRDYGYGAFLLAGVQMAQLFEAEGNSAEGNSADVGESMDIVTERLYEMALEGKVPAKTSVKPNDARAEQHLQSMQADGSWKDLDYAFTGRPWPTQEHAERFYQIAIAYQDDESPLYHRPEVKEQLWKAADFLHRHFQPSVHWHSTEVTMPSSWLPGLLLMKTGDGFGFSQEDLLRFADLVPFNKTPKNGVNVIYVNQPNLYKAAIEGNADEIRAAFEAIAGVVRIMPGDEEGLKQDFSWHQHERLVFFHGYGNKAITMSMAYYGLVEGTAFAFSDAAKDLITDYLLDGQQWVLHNGTYDYGVNGRGLVGFPLNVDMLLAPINQLIDSGVARRSELAAFKAQYAGAPFPTPGNRHFWKSDMLVQRGPDWYFSIRNTSSRNVSTETINGENAKNGYLGVGSRCIMVSGREYLDIFPAWDWSRLPGTTFESGKEFRTQKWVMYPPFEYAGGVSNGRYGLAVYNQDLGGEEKLHLRKMETFRSVAVKKLDLMTDDGIYSIGTGITAKADNPVLSNLNQCNASGPVIISDGRRVATLKTDQLTSKDLRWVHHDGVGYVFPRPQAVTVASQEQTGRQSDISTRSKDTRVVRRNVFSAWIDHGTRPDGATYEYIVLPGKTAAEVESWQNSFRTIVNNDAVQAVACDAKGLYGAAFYSAGGRIRLGQDLELSVDKPCAILIERSDEDTFVVSVSDPTAGAVKEVVLTIEGYQAKATERFILPAGEYLGSSLTRTLNW
jgi:chondroitin AC lyase